MPETRAELTLHMGKRARIFSTHPRTSTLELTQLEAQLRDVALQQLSMATGGMGEHSCRSHRFTALLTKDRAPADSRSSFQLKSPSFLPMPGTMCSPPSHCSAPPATLAMELVLLSKMCWTVFITIMEI